MAPNKNDDELIYGKNAVLAYLEQNEAARDADNTQSRVNKLFLAPSTHSDKRLDRIRALAKRFCAFR